MNYKRLTLYNDALSSFTVPDRDVLKLNYIRTERELIFDFGLLFSCVVYFVVSIENQSDYSIH
jgi:hypothetical protein